MSLGNSGSNDETHVRKWCAKTFFKQHPIEIPRIKSMTLLRDYLVGYIFLLKKFRVVKT